jgi:hypothetical protein
LAGPPRLQKRCGRPIQQDPKSGYWHLFLRYDGKQYHKSLKTKEQGEAEGLKGHVELTLLDLERGRLALPPLATDPKTGPSSSRSVRPP